MKKGSTPVAASQNVASGAADNGVPKKKGYQPADGSWVAELEAAKGELDEVADRKRGEALKAYLRLCRARSKLRQWKDLEDDSDEALELCSSLSVSSSSNHAARIADWKARFQLYREKARQELAVETSLDIPQVKKMLRRSIKESIALDLVSRPDEGFPNANLLQSAAVDGDMRLMEALVAHGAAVDAPFLSESKDGKKLTIEAPTDATALVILCANLATNDKIFSQTELFVHPDDEWEMGLYAACAMQLVRLGADPNRKLNLCNAPDSYHSRAYRMGGFDGKSAYELAKLTKRTDLIELMEQHLRCSPEERAEIVHCRCGSRLPWKACHSTGVGQPPHFLHVDGRTTYRVSPLARCPCNITAKVHYECCWKDTSLPMYLIDTDGEYYFRPPKRRTPAERIREIKAAYSLPCEEEDYDEEEEDDDDDTYDEDKYDDITNEELDRKYPEMNGKEMAASIRASPEFSRAVFAGVNTKSQLINWDMEVYAGCIERLDPPFLWKDLHWRLDKPELLMRTEMWNEALEQYCDDVGLEGYERQRTIDKHRANPCAPCGRMGCNAFEDEVKGFQRCSRCKLIAYCGRACQKLDWREHRKACTG